MSCQFGAHVFVEHICPHCGETEQDYIDRLERVVLIAAHHVADINSLSFSNPENLDDKEYPQCFYPFWTRCFWGKSDIKSQKKGGDPMEKKPVEKKKAVKMPMSKPKKMC